MSLREELSLGVKDAMKAREAGKLRLKVLRMVMAAVKNKEIDAKRQLDDEEVLEVLAKEAKLRQESIPEWEKAGRQEQVAELRQEIAVLEEYLPEQMDENAIRALVQDAISSTGTLSMKEMGKVMGLIMPQVKGRADGKLVNKIVKELLS